MTGTDAGRIAEKIRRALPGLSLSERAEELAEFRAANPLLDPTPTPLGVARPRDVSELQDLVRLANREGFALTPVSSQSPHLKGGIAAPISTLLVDLSFWKRIDLIDRRNRVCRIEPGVTYGELLAALAPFGLTVSLPLTPRPGKSALAAVMDREPTTWPNKQWDLADPLACAEIVFGTGELFRTGAAGGPGSIEQQRAAGGALKSPLGPSQTDFQRVVQAAQGTMGIVTWITIRAELTPTVSEPFLLAAEELPQLLPCVYEVQRAGLGEHSFLMNRTAAALLLALDRPERFGEIRSSLPAFLYLQNVAGFERLARERLEYHREDIREIAEKHGLSPAPSLGLATAADLLNQATAPSGTRDFRHARRGHCLNIFFLSTLDRAPDLCRRFLETVRNFGLDPEDAGIYLQPVMQNHACHFEFMVPVNPAEASEIEKMKRLEEEAVSSLRAGGAFFSRPYGAALATAFDDNPVNADVLKKIKGVFDPNGVLNPGRLGII